MQTDSYVFSILYKLINFSLPLNPAIHRMGNAPNILSGIWRTKRFSTLIYILLQAFQNFSRLLISELIINLKYTFNIPFRITLKTIIMGTSSQLHDGAQLKFYPHLAQRYYLWIGFKRNPGQDLELPFKQ